MMLGSYTKLNNGIWIQQLFTCRICPSQQSRSAPRLPITSYTKTYPSTAIIWQLYHQKIDSGCRIPLFFERRNDTWVVIAKAALTDQWLLWLICINYDELHRQPVWKGDRFQCPDSTPLLAASLPTDVTCASIESDICEFDSSQAVGYTITSGPECGTSSTAIASVKYFCCSL